MKKREANIELLRLLLFLLVIALHVVAPFRMSRWDKFEPNWIFTDTVASIARLCTNVFVIISGFFYASSIDKRPGQTVAKLLLPVIFYMQFYLFLEVDVGFSEAVRRVYIGALTSYYNMYHLWFTQTFLVLSLLAPLLSFGLLHAEQRTHRVVMWTLITVSSILPTFRMTTGLEWFDLRLFNAPIVLFLALFTIGAYIRKYPPRMPWGLAFILLCAAQLFIIFMSRLYHSRYSPINYIRLHRGEIESLDDPIATWIEHSGLSDAFANPANIVIVAASVLLFIFLAKLHFNSNFIAKLAKHVFPAYVIHVFWIEVFSKLWDGRFDLFSEYWHTSEQYPLFIFIYILAVFSVSLLTNIFFSSILKLVKMAFVR